MEIDNNNVNTRDCSSVQALVQVRVMYLEVIGENITFQGWMMVVRIEKVCSLSEARRS